MEQNFENQLSRSELSESQAQLSVAERCLEEEKRFVAKLLLDLSESEEQLHGATRGCGETEEEKKLGIEAEPEKKKLSPHR